MSNLITRTVVTTAMDEFMDESSCSTRHLSSLFASFLTGERSHEMQFQKYFVLYSGNPIDLRNKYEDRDGMMLQQPLIDRVPVRVSSTSRDEDGNYYATFIGTFQANNALKFDDGKVSDLSLALVTGDMILAFTSFDINVYKMMCSGSRAEIKWKLQLKHITKIIQHEVISNA